MSSTTVHSNNQKERITTSVAGSAFVATEKTLEVPPQGQVFEVISSYIEEQGNMEIPVGNCKLHENGVLETENGNITIGEKAYKNALDSKARKVEMKAKAESKDREVRSAGVDR